MHEIIDHVGKVLRLDELGNVASKIDPSHTSLDEFAKSEPTWESIQAMAQQIVRDSEVEIDELRAKDDGERDKQRENVLLMHKYFLLYEEISYAMNHGDIGRVEDCFTPWIWIFLGCGKLKYAAEMRRYLENVHFRYRSGLRCVPLLVMGKRLAGKAIRMNILKNPTGKKGRFRAIDWIVEHNNLYTKVSPSAATVPLVSICESLS